METPSHDRFAGIDARYRRIFAQNPLAMWIYDLQTLRVLAANEAALRQYGYSRQEFVGLGLLDLHAQDDAARLLEHLKQPLIERVAQRCWRHRHRSGALMEVEISTEDLELDGACARMVMVRDVSEQRRFEQRLLEERQTFEAVVNTTNNGIISVDGDGLVELFNPAAERIFGRSGGSMRGQTLDVLMPPGYGPLHLQQLRSFAATGTSSRAMGLAPVKGLHSDGRELDLEVAISQVSVGARTLLIACVRDVTAHLRVATEFQRSREQLSDLAHRLMSQEKRLVKDLAQTLHDHLGQTMAAIRMAHETILALQGDATRTDVVRLQAQMGVLIDHANAQIRQVLADLRPPLLEEQGFAAALDNELRNRSLTRPRIDFSFDVGPGVELLRWPGEVEYAAFMVAREAVENALRHSASQSVSVRLSGSSGCLRLEVADRGVGITADTSPRTRHLGILGMHERAQAIGATVKVQRGPDQGTLVSFNWMVAP